MTDVQNTNTKLYAKNEFIQCNCTKADTNTCQVLRYWLDFCMLISIYFWFGCQQQCGEPELEVKWPLYKVSAPTNAYLTVIKISQSPNGKKCELCGTHMKILSALCWLHFLLLPVTCNNHHRHIVANRQVMLKGVFSLGKFGLRFWGDVFCD